MKSLFKTLNKTVSDILHYGKENSVEDVVKSVFETILSAERDDFLSTNKMPDNKANGYYCRLAKGVNKYFSLMVPRDRLSLFKPVFMQTIMNQDNQVMDLAFSLYAKGLTTREVSSTIEKMYGKKFSRSSVSRITKTFQKEREKWLSRSLRTRYYFIYIDVIRIPVRRDSVAKEAFYIAIALNEDLKREVLGVYHLPEENLDGWQEVLQDLKNRGIKSVLMIIADGFKHLEKVVNQEFPSALFQKCLVHKIRNVISKVRAQDKEIIVNDFHKVFELENPSYNIEDGIKQLMWFLNKWKKIYPHITRQFEKSNWHYYFAYLKFPFQIQRMIYTTNWIERLNKTIRRTTKIRCSFPNSDSAMNLVCACLMDVEEGTYKYPITSFKKVKFELDQMLET